jgi:anti-sigma factor RsiW
MKCQQIREQMPDLAAGLNTASPEMEAHLHTCAKCTEELAGVRQTMAMLDEWQVPELSPYFDTRLNARLREEMAKPASGWMHWFQRPLLAVALGLLMAVGIAVFHNGDVNPGGAPMAQIETGTAVSDLQTLDKNNDLYSDFDVLDDLQVQDNVTANQ